QRDARRLGWVFLFSFLMLGLLTSLGGCTRRFFRRRADAEVDTVLAQKDKYPGWWKLQDYFIYPHPLSRFADPTDPDRPPMPPDDPAAWDLSPHPQRPLLKGYKYWQGTGYLELLRKWDEENRTKAEAELAAKKNIEEEEGAEPLLPGENKTFAERATEVNDQIERELNSAITATSALPEASKPAQYQESKPFLLNLEQIVQLGFLNSREFQTVREELYLTALTVTAERFAFIAQPFATEQLVRESSGAQSADGRTNRWLASTTTGFTKSFSTGALLLLNFANQTAYNLGGGAAGTTSVSNISLDFVQPFLAGGGRAVALEPLTQAERNLVYAIRDFYRNRQEFFVFFAAGQSTGFIPGVGAGVVALSPGTVQSPGAFVPGAFTLPLVANPATVQVAPGAGGRLGAVLNSGVFITPQGYLSANLGRATLVHLYKNIQALQRFLRLFEQYLAGGIVSQVQKGQVEQQLLASVENVLGQHANYRVSLDQLKQQLGLPMTVAIDLTPAPLQPMVKLIAEYEQLSIDTERVSFNALNYGRSSEANQLRARLHRMIERTPLMRNTQTRERTLRRWAYWENVGKDQSPNERLKILQERLNGLIQEREDLRAKRASAPGEPLPEADMQRLNELYFDFDLGSLELALSIYEAEPWKTTENPEARLRTAQGLFRGVYRYLLSVADKAFVERQENIKNQWPALPAMHAEGVDLLSVSEPEALLAVERTTMNYRVDLMNVRAQLTDAWRKIRVSANALMGTFNVDYHLDASTPAGGGNPFALGGSRTRHELIFNAQLPLVRILQRNNYRSTLINYQQNRRSLMAFEDQLLFNVRFDLRQIRVLGNNYQRVQKRQIELAYMQVDQALQQFSQPQAPTGADMPGLVGPTERRPTVGDAAALTNQLLNTQASLLRSQNDLYSTWINYLISRMNLYRDMGILPLDNRGVWIDDDETSLDASHHRQPAGEQQPASPPDELPAPRPERRPERLPDPRPEPAAQGAALEPGE